MLQNMLQAWRKASVRQRRGSLLVEAMLGIVLFGVFATATFLTLLTGQESSQEGADRIRGVHFTEQALEVAKAIRDRDFADIAVEGQHGFTLDEAGEWVLSGSSIERYGYTTSLFIHVIADDKIRAAARSTWKHGYHRSGATVLSTELTDWRSRSAGVGDWSNPSQAAELIVTGPPYLGGIAVAGDYAFVTSAADGAGLYVFDVSDENAPFRVSTDFALPGGAQSPLVYNDTLYLVASEAGDEILAYDVSDPVSLNAATVPIASYDIPGGTNRGTALARKGTTLLAGALGDADESEFYALDISNPAQIMLTGEFNIAENPTVNDVYVSGIFAYLATASDIHEITIIDVSDPAAMQLHAAYNALDAHDGMAVRSSGTGFYLGRAAGAAIDEYLLITGSGGVPSTNPLNTYGADLGAAGEGAVNAMAVDTLGCYAFLATDYTYKEMQVRSARYKTIPEEAYIDLASDARGVFYDMMTDRLYVSTNTGFLIFTPGTGGDCL